MSDNENSKSQFSNAELLDKSQSDLFIESENLGSMSMNSSARRKVRVKVHRSKEAEGKTSSQRHKHSKSNRITLEKPESVQSIPVEKSDDDQSGLSSSALTGFEYTMAPNDKMVDPEPISQELTFLNDKDEISMTFSELEPDLQETEVDPQSKFVKNDIKESESEPDSEKEAPVETIIDTYVGNEKPYSEVFAGISFEGETDPFFVQIEKELVESSMAKKQKEKPSQTYDNIDFGSPIIEYKEITNENIPIIDSSTLYPKSTNPYLHNEWNEFNKNQAEPVEPVTNDEFVELVTASGSSAEFVEADSDDSAALSFIELDSDKGSKAIPVIPIDKNASKHSDNEYEYVEESEPENPKKKVEDDELDYSNLEGGYDSNEDD